MKITIDALPLLGDGGITSYVRGLVQALLNFDRANEYEFLFRSYPRERRRAMARLRQDPAFSQVRFRGIPIPDSLLEQAWRLGGSTGWMFPMTSRADLFLATLLVAPWLGPGRVVPLVYDLIPFRFPQWYGQDAMGLERRLRTVARQARIWMTISEATRSDLQEFLGIPAEAIRVVYPGVDPIFRPSAPSSRRQELFSRYGIEPPYVLYVGGYGAHKNVETLLMAFSLVREKSSRRCRLVLVGPRRWAREGLAGTSDLHQDGAVSFLGYVPREDLALLYGAADVFLSVSLYEGFGLPALEAMACGTPVVASSAGALPEVVGDAGILVDPTDESAIAETLCRVLGDEGLRQELRGRGLRQAARFSWTEGARRTLKVFEAVRRAA